MNHQIFRTFCRLVSLGVFPTHCNDCNYMGYLVCSRHKGLWSIAVHNKKGDERGYGIYLPNIGPSRRFVLSPSWRRRISECKQCKQDYNKIPSRKNAMGGVSWTGIWESKCMNGVMYTSN